MEVEEDDEGLQSPPAHPLHHSWCHRDEVLLKETAVQKSNPCRIKVKLSAKLFYQHLLYKPILETGMSHVSTWTSLTTTTCGISSLPLPSFWLLSFY